MHFYQICQVNWHTVIIIRIAIYIKRSKRYLIFLVSDFEFFISWLCITLNYNLALAVYVCLGSLWALLLFLAMIWHIICDPCKQFHDFYHKCVSMYIYAIYVLFHGCHKHIIFLFVIIRLCLLKAFLFLFWCTFLCCEEFTCIYCEVFFFLLHQYSLKLLFLKAM